MAADQVGAGGGLRSGQSNFEGEQSHRVALQAASLIHPIEVQKTKIMASGPFTSWQIDGETMETVADYFFGLQNHHRW